MSTQSTYPAEQTGKGAVSRETYVKPSYTSREVEGAYEVSVVMPGVNKEGLDVNLEGNVLTLTGRPNKHVPETWRVLHEELGRRNFRLRLELNFNFDGQGITAKVEDGVLTLRLPVTEAAKPRLIPVQ